METRTGDRASNYALTPAARIDVFGIWSYIAGDNPQAADRVEADLLRACAEVAVRRDLGHWRRDLTAKPVRFYTVAGTYLIVYDPATAPLEIMRVFHGAQDVAAELAE